MPREIETGSKLPAGCETFREGAAIERFAKLARHRGVIHAALGLAGADGITYAQHRLPAAAVGVVSHANVIGLPADEVFVGLRRIREAAAVEPHHADCDEGMEQVRRFPGIGPGSACDLGGVERPVLERCEEIELHTRQKSKRRIGGLSQRLNGAGENRLILAHRVSRAEANRRRSLAGAVTLSPSCHALGGLDPGDPRPSPRAGKPEDDAGSAEPEQLAQRARTAQDPLEQLLARR